jgi:hypothetical protein
MTERLQGRLLSERSIDSDVTSSNEPRTGRRAIRSVTVNAAGEGMREAESALGWPARAGKLVLTLALDRVAAYYRIR